MYLAIFTCIKKPFSRLNTIIIIASLFSLKTVYAQSPDFPVSLTLEMANGKANSVAQGGILYDGDLIKGILSVNEKKWDGKTKFYCYVFHYNDNDPEVVNLIYPAGAGVSNNRLPEFKNDGKAAGKITLFEGMISAPFGRDNFVLIMTERPLDVSSLRERRRGDTTSLKDELIKLIKGSRLSDFYQEGSGAVHIKTLNIESRPLGEKNGLAKSQTGLKKVFAVNDSAEIFYTPNPQANVVRDSFPTLEIIDPIFDTAIMRGAKVISGATKKILMRGIAVDWRRGIRSVTINQQPADTYRESSGYFDFLYEPKDGSNVADVTVTNNNGYTRTLRLKFIYQPDKQTITAEGKDYLLVIGINNYRSWPVLNNAQKDASDFKRIMIAQYGFKQEYTKELLNENATRKNIYGQLRNFVSELTPNDRLVIYFSGHGYYDSTMELGFWIPADAGENASDEYLNNRDVTLMVQKMKAKSIFIIADACYSGQLLRDMQKAGSGDYRSRMVLCSGKLKPVSDGKPGGNSPFAQQVLSYLQNAKSNEVLASALIQNVKDSFKSDNQKPVGGPIDEVGDENGDFILKRK
jgi:hypothetical protein